MDVDARAAGRRTRAGTSRLVDRPARAVSAAVGAGPAALAGVGRRRATAAYARPSRRGADRTDVVLPGRKREGWTLNIVLDTSGSMADEMPRALGAIADFCEAVGVDQVRLVQCDTAVAATSSCARRRSPAGRSPATAAAT